MAIIKSSEFFQKSSELESCSVFGGDAGKEAKVMAKKIIIPAVDGYVTIIDGDRETNAKVAKIDKIKDGWYLTFYSWTAIAVLQTGKGYWILRKEDHKNGHPIEDAIELRILNKNRPKTIRR